MSLSLPPGIRFYPSDEQLLCYYLSNKNRTIIRNTDDVNNNDLIGYDLIKELDLYNYEPFHLPENACYAYGYKGRKRHWYCYTKVRVLKGSRGRRGEGGKRRAKGGFWRRSGRVRDVVGPGGNVVVGTRTRFVFYLGNSRKSAVRTDWFLYEYALDHVKASFVLCRVFVKSRGGNSTSENVISSCAEESVSAVRHIGIQHDGFLTPDIVEAKVRNDDSVDGKDDLSRYSVKLSRELDDQVNKQVRTPGLTDGNVFVNNETAQQLLSIVEEDFIELDDLMD